jgi:hypothetical protein
VKHHLGLALASLLAGGALAAAGTPATEAASHEPFLEVAWGVGAAWRPGQFQWHDSRTVVNVPLNAAGGLPNRPGAETSFRLAVRSAAASPVHLGLAVVDPDPLGPTEVEPGYYAELFDQVHVTLREGVTVLADDLAPALGHSPVAGTLPAAAGGYRLFDVTFRLADQTDNRWLKAWTGFQLVVTATGDEPPTPPSAEPPPSPTPPEAWPKKVPTGGTIAAQAWPVAVLGLGAALLAVGTLLAIRALRRQEAPDD